MSYVEALNRMRAAQQIQDEEVAHTIADEILCDYLVGLGATEIVDEWRKIHKRYS